MKVPRVVTIVLAMAFFILVGVIAVVVIDACRDYDDLQPPESRDALTTIYPAHQLNR